MCYTINMKKYFIFFILICSFFSIHYSLEASSFTGFIPGQIWYSKDPLVEGETVKIYTALFNNDDSSLSAKVEFYDKNVLLGSRDVVVSSMNIEDVSISWKVTSGDHLISAKIISPSITTGGKKKIITVENDITETNRKFVPVVLTTIEGKPATSTDVIKSQLDKATSSLDSILPNSISSPVSKNLGVVENLRVDTLEKIIETSSEAKNKIDELNNITNNVNSNKSDGKIVANNNNTGIVSATEKPITYLKLIFFSILSFVFGNKLVFYLLIILTLFFIIRGIYRKISKS